jgi:hypothetical protein
MANLLKKAEQIKLVKKQKKFPWLLVGFGFQKMLLEFNRIEALVFLFIWSMVSSTNWLYKIKLLNFNFINH